MVKRKNISLIAAVIICMISVGVMLVVLAVSEKKGEKEVFTPPPFEEKAVQGVPDVPDDLGWSELDVDAYKFSICGGITVENGRADIWFANPDSNSVWLKLRVLDKDDNILGETGIIKPGEYVQTMTFTRVPNEGALIGLKVMAYEPEAYYSAGSVMLNTTVTGGDYGEKNN